MELADRFPVKKLLFELKAAFSSHSRCPDRKSGEELLYGLYDG